MDLNFWREVEGDKCWRSYNLISGMEPLKPAVEAVKKGALRLSKPPDLNRLLIGCNALDKTSLVAGRNKGSKKEKKLAKSRDDRDLCKNQLKLKQKRLKSMPTDARVLTGWKTVRERTGSTLAPWCKSREVGRSEANCAAIPSELIERTFRPEKGSLPQQ